METFHDVFYTYIRILNLDTANMPLGGTVVEWVALLPLGKNLLGLNLCQCVFVWSLHVFSGYSGFPPTSQKHAEWG